MVVADSEVVMVEVEVVAMVAVELEFVSSFNRDTALSVITADLNMKALAQGAQASEEVVVTGAAAATVVVDMVVEAEYASITRKVLVPMVPTADLNMNRLCHEDYI